MRYLKLNFLKAMLPLVFLSGIPPLELYGQRAMRDSLLQVIQLSKPDTTRVNALYELSFSYVNTSPDSAVFYGLQAFELAKKINYQKGVANADYALGAGSFRKGELKKAASFFKDCEAIAKKIDDKSLAIKACIGLGNTSLMLGSYDSAIVFFQQGIALSEETNDHTRLATLLNNIGNIHSNQMRKREAISYYRRSLQVSSRLKDTADLALAYSNLASVYKTLNVLDSAVMYVDSTLIMTEVTGDLYTQSMMFGVKGLIELEQKKYAEAMVNLRQSLKTFSDQGNNADAAELWNALGETFYETQQFDSAIYCYRQGLSMAQATGAAESIGSAYAGLSRCYAALNSFKDAYEYLSKYIVVQNQYLDSLNIKTVAELNAKYESVSKQRKIELLEKDQLIQAEKAERERTVRNFLIGGGLLLLLFMFMIYKRYQERKKLSDELSHSLTELKQTQQQLIATEKQKEQENVRLRISRDIHDEIGSNLTKIALLSELLSAEPVVHGNDSKKSLDKIAMYARDVNNSLSEIVWSVNPKQDTLESLIAYMRNYVHSFLQDTGIHFTIDFPAETDNRDLNPDCKRTIFLVLKETLNNCVKHADAQNITIRFRAGKEHFEMIIQDDGKGFNVNDKSLQGNGLSNLEYRMRQFNGNYTVISSPQQGCEVRVSGDLV